MSRPVVQLGLLLVVEKTRSRGLSRFPLSAALFLLPSVLLGQAGSDPGMLVRGSVLSNQGEFDTAVHLLREPTLYEQMAMLTGQGPNEEVSGTSAFSFRESERAFEVRAPVPDAGWMVVQPARRGFFAGAVALPLIGPLSHVLLPPIVPRPGASCRLRMIEPVSAWVAPDRRIRDVEGLATPRWRTWRPWLRLDATTYRERWLDPVGQWRSGSRAFQVTVGSPGYLPSDFECKAGALTEVRLEPREGPLLEVELVLDGGGDAPGSAARALGAAVLVHADGWPAGVADDQGRILVPRGSFRVLGPSGGEWTLEVESSGTWVFPAPERRAMALLPNGLELPASTGAMVLHWSQTGALLAREEIPLTEVGPPGEQRMAWIVRPPSGVVETTVLVLGFDPATFDWSLRPGEIELTAYQVIEGVVLDGRSGDPLPGAEVALYGDHPGGLGHLDMTASNGVFRIESSAGLAARRLVVRAPGYRPAPLAGRALASALGSGLLVVRLEPAATLVGRVVSSGGQGLAGSAALLGRQGPFAPPSVGSVDQFLASSPALHAVARADAGGTFRFPEVSSGVSSVAVGAPGYATRFLPLRGWELVASAAAERASSYDLGDVVLVPELAVEGVVTDEGGLPLVGAVVGFARSPEVIGAYGLTGVSLPTGQVQTGVEGRFRIGGLAESALIDLKVKHPGHASVELPRVAVSEAAGLVWLSIEMKEALGLEGRVVDEATGEGVEAARLQLLDRTERRQLALERTGPEGRFVLGGLASLDGILEVEAFGYEPVRHELTDEDAVRPLADDGLVLALRRGRASVRGVVLQGGAPVAGAAVRMNSRGHVVTDAAGRFELSGLPEGESMVFCWPSGDESDQPIIWYRDVRPGINEFVFDLTPVEVSGRVEDARGSPVGGATVRVARLLAPSDEARSAPDGSFSLWVTPGLYRARAEADGYAPSVQEIDVGSTGPVRVVLRLTVARELRVRVVGLAAGEAAAVEVGLETAPLQPGGGGRLGRFADSDGVEPVFVTRNPPEGSAILVARVRSSGRMQRRVVDVLASGTTEVEIAFDDTESSGRLTGLVTVDGEPMAGAPVFVVDERAGDAWAVRTDHQGTYTVDGLRHGRVDVAAVGERRTLRVEGESRVDFRARGAMLRGRVVLADSGAPAAGLEVVATPAHVPLEVAANLAQTMSALSGEDGSFRIGGLYQVPYRVVARRRVGPILGSVTLDLAVSVGETLISVREAGVE